MKSDLLGPPDPAEGQASTGESAVSCCLRIITLSSDDKSHEGWQTAMESAMHKLADVSIVS